MSSKNIIKRATNKTINEILKDYNNSVQDDNIKKVLSKDSKLVKCCCDC